MQYPPEILTTDRLCLRACCLEDAPLLYERYTGSKKVSEFLQRNVHADVGQTKRFIEEWGVNSWSSNNGKYAWSLSERNKADVFGLFLMSIEGDAAEIHYGISYDKWGHGYVTEAGSSVMAWIRDTSRINYVSTVCDVEHAASIRVLEKIGLKKNQILKDRLCLPLKGDAKRDAYLFEWKRGIYKD